MTNPFLALVVFAFATHRITRFVVKDSLTERVREFVRARCHTEMERRDVWSQKVLERKSVPKPHSPWTPVFGLISCAWCVSVWSGAFVVAMTRFEGGWFHYATYALALSSVAGFLHSIDERL